MRAHKLMSISLLVVGLLASGCGTDWTYENASVTDVVVVGQNEKTVQFEVTGVWGDTQGKFVRFDVKRSGNTIRVDMVGKTPHDGIHRPAVITLSQLLEIRVGQPGTYSFEFSTWNGEPETTVVEVE